MKLIVASYDKAALLAIQLVINGTLFVAAVAVGW